MIHLAISRGGIRSALHRMLVSSSRTDSELAAGALMDAEAELAKGEQLTPPRARTGAHVLSTRQMQCGRWSDQFSAHSRGSF